MSFNNSRSCKSESNVRGMAEPKYGTLRSNKSRVLSSHVLEENKASSESEVNQIFVDDRIIFTLFIHSYIHINDLFDFVVILLINS